MRSFLIKFLAIGMLAILLLIAGVMVRGVVKDRIANRNVASQSIADSLADSQILGGPILVLEYTEQFNEATHGKKGEILKIEAKSTEHSLRIFPENLALEGNLASDPHYRGIFHVNAYLLSGKLSGNFRIPALQELAHSHPDGRIRLDAARIVLGVSDPRGLHAISLETNGHPATLESGSTLSELGNGIHAGIRDTDTLADSTISFLVTLQLAGTDRLSLIPLGRITQAHLSSSWPHPSFGGRFLPGHFTVTQTGFYAHWQVSALASNARQVLSESGRERSISLADSFSVALIDPVDIYSLSDRASKYAELFVLLTLSAFLLFELLRGLNLHPLNYLLISAALLIFFLLLIALAERIGFGYAYLTAGTACVLLIGFYSAHLLRSMRLAALFMLGLGLLYGSIYTILLSEQNALLMGSLLLFCLLAGVMIGTRKVDWSRLLSARQPGSQTKC